MRYGPFTSRPPLPCTLNEGEKKAASCRNLEHFGAELLPWNAQGLLNLHRALGRDRSVPVFETPCRGLRNAQQFAHSFARKAPLLPVFAQKFVRFTHSDTYGIEVSCRKSIPIVSDWPAACRYHLHMKPHDDLWKSWPYRLKVHLKKNDLNLAKLAEKMLDDEGKALAESTLRSWTNGHRSVNLSDFFELCFQAGADPVQILFGRPLMSDDVKNRIGALAHTVMDSTPADNYVALDKAHHTAESKQRDRKEEAAEPVMRRRK